MAELSDQSFDMNENAALNAPLTEDSGEINMSRLDTDILVIEKQPETPGMEDPNEIEGMVGMEFEDDEIDDENVELSPDGVLDENTIGRGLSNLGRSADGMHQVYLHLTIPGFNLIDINILKDYIHLQKVELPHNQLTDLSVLSYLPHLIILDVSHNQLTTILDFTPPKNLQQVDLSYNQIEVMSDLSAHHSLKKLNLSYNSIKEISGLSECRRLVDLNLAHNKIKQIQNLQNLPIQFLNLGHNELVMIENLETLHRLRAIDLSGNKVRSLAGLENHDLLESINLEDNEVIDLIEIKYLQKLRMLRDVDLHRNPIQQLPDYRLSILFRLQALTQLDKHKVDCEEKVGARNMFDPPLEVVAARDHIMHVVYSFLQPAKVLDSTLPSKDTPYPMLVLVGPQGSGKKDLGLKLVEEFSEFFGFGVSHTTRNPYTGEENAKDYHFTNLEDFEIDIKMGRFLQTHQHHGSWFGLQMDSIQNIARQGLACVVHMELEGVLTMKNTHFEPRYVLIMPMDKEAHERRLRDRGLLTDNQILETVKSGDIYSNYNQDHPGFFDMMINSDDIQQAYIQLRQLVMDYLGIGSSSPTMDVAIDSSSKIETIDHFPPPTSTSNLMNRTWSRPSVSETQSLRAPSGRGIVEEESLKLRLSAAKDVVAGYIPPLYQQLLDSCPKSVPQTVNSQVGLGDEGMRSASAPAKHLPVRNGPPRMDSPDSSASIITTSNLSDLDSAADLEPGNTNVSPKTKDNVVTPLELTEEAYNSNSSTRLNAPRPPSATRPDSQNSQRANLNRPGSERHKILPPITPVH